MTSVEGPKKTCFYTQICRPTENIDNDDNSQAPPVALVILVHGINEHIERYKHVFDRLSSRGIATFAFDQRGFGQTAVKNHNSFGVTTGADQLADLDFFIQHASKEISSPSSATPSSNVPIFLFGHSMGGGIVLDYVTDTSDVTAAGRNLISTSKGGIIASAPWVTSYAAPPDSIKVKAGSLASKILPTWFKIPVSIDPAYLTHDPQVNDSYINDPLCKSSDSVKLLADCISRGVRLLDSSYAHYPQDLPILFVHGDADKVTSHKATEEFSNKINANDKTMKIYPNYYHELHNELGDDKIVEIDYIIQWLTDQAAKS